MTAKIFKHGGSQAVRLPKAFRFKGTEVEIERHGDEVVLRPPRARPMSVADVIRELKEKFPDSPGWPDRNQPRQQQKRDWD
jgi:antitoxin VapB